MAFIDPNAPPLTLGTAPPAPYGTPNPDPNAPPGADQGSIPVIQGKNGSMHLPGGGSPFTAMRKSAVGKGNGYGPNEMPPLDDYFKSRLLTDAAGAKDGDTPPTLSSADDTTLAGIANDYATKFIPGALEGAYQRKADKSEIESHVARFNMQFANDLPRFKQHLADLDNKSPAVAAAKKPGLVDQAMAPGGAVDQAKTLLQRVAGNTDVGLANILHGIPGLINNAAGVVGLGGAPDAAGAAQDVLRAPEAYLREGGQQNLPGGSQVDPLANKNLAAHPMLTGAADIAGGLLPSLAASVGGPLAMGAVGAAQGGGTASHEQGARIAAMPEAQLHQIPEYQQALAATKDPVKARAAVAASAEQSAEQMGQIFGAITNTFGGGALTKPVQAAIVKMVGPSIVKRVLASSIGEAAGFTALGAGQNAAETGAVNTATGEKNDADLGAGAGTNSLFGLVFGGLGALAHAKVNPLMAPKPGAAEVKPGAAPTTETPTPKPGEAQNGAYKQAYQSTVADPDHQVKPGTPEEKALPTMIEALDQFNSRYAALHENATPEEKAQASAQFDQDWRAQFKIPTAEAAPAAKPAQEGEAPSPAEAAAAVEEPQVSANKAPDAAETPAEEALHPGAVREAAAAGPEPGEVREQAPAAEAVPLRELVTQTGVDTRLPFGVTERVATELRSSLGRDPTPKELNDHASMVLDEAMSQPGVNRLLPAYARREAIGKLLEDEPTKLPDGQAINEQAQKMLQGKGVDSAIQKRVDEFERPVKEAAAKKAEEDAARKEQENAQQAAEESKRQADDLAASKARHAEYKRRGDELAAQEEAAKTARIQKDIEDSKARHADYAKVGAEERKKANFRELLKETRRPKAEAASQEGEAAHSRSTDESGAPSGQTPKTVRDGLVKGLDEKSVRALEKADLLQIVQSERDLERLRPGSTDPRFRTKAYYDGRKSFLVADNIKPGEELGAVMHEVGAHYGLKRMLPPDLWAELQAYVKSGGTGADAVELAAARKAAIESDPARDKVDEEALAHMVEANHTVVGSIWNRAWVAAKAFIYKHFGTLLSPSARQKLISNDVIRSLVRGALKPQGLDAYKAPGAVEAPLYSRKPTAFKTLDEVRNAWHQTTEPTKEEQQTDSQERTKDWTTRNVNELKPLQHLNRALEKGGTKVTPDKNIFMSMTNLNGTVRHEVNHDIAGYAEPAKAEFVKSALQLGFKGVKGFKEFLGHVTDAISARHALDVNKLEYYKSVKLSPEAEARRAPLLQDVFNGKLDPKEWMPKLREIVNAPGAKIETGGKRQASGISDEMAYKLIENAKKAGITDQVAEHLNSVLDPIRQRTLARGRESGAYTAEQGRIVQAYKSKWYLPFKGFAEDSATGLDNTRRPMGAFNKDTTAAREGRNTQSKNPLENLFTDLANGGKDVGYNQTAKTIFKAILDPKINEKLGVVVKSYDINKLTNDALAGGGKLSDMAGLWRDPNTVIYKNGKDWHVMHFPEGSKELAAIKTIETDKSLKGLSAKVSIATNFIARGKTAYSPIFTLYSALARDSTGYPILAAVDHGPAIAGSYVKNLIGFGGPFGAWKTYANVFKGVNNFGAIEKMAQANPNSFAGWAYRLSKSGGGLDFKAELSNIKTAQGLSKQMNADARSPLNPAKLLHSAAEFLDALATSSIATGRVSMFKSLVEHGMSEQEAGFYTKRMENFEQTSEGSRQMNAWFPFWRAGVANADRMYELVHKPNGDFDKKKFGAVMVTGVAAAAAYWNFVLKQYYGDDAKKLKLNTLSQNFVIPNPYGDPIKVPMGLGLPRLMLGLGIIATRMGEGSTTPTDAYEAIKNTLFENLTPLKPSEGKDGSSVGDRALDLLMAVVPGVGRAPAELARNQSSFGRDIYETPYPNDHRFASDSGFRSTPDEWKELAQGLRKTTGADVHPESLQYLANSYGQGYLTEALRYFNMKNKEEQGKVTSITDTPFIPRFTTGDIKYADTNAFYQKRDELVNASKEAETLKQNGKPIPAQLQKQIDEEKHFESISRAHGKELRAVEQNNLLSSQAKAAQLAVINSRYQQAQKQLTGEAQRLGR